MVNLILNPTFDHEITFPNITLSGSASIDTDTNVLSFSGTGRATLNLSEPMQPGHTYLFSCTYAQDPNTMPIRLLPMGVEMANEVRFTYEGAEPQPFLIINSYATSGGTVSNPSLSE